MSTTIDERVVEMRFDNKHFEQNVNQTLSTLDKLKAKLNLPGASKSLEGVQKAANNVNMNGLSGAIDTVQAKFSAMQVIGVTALANITNSAVNAGKRMISALTIDPVKTGFKEYETQMNAVQTILANTQSKGSTIEDVNAALAELNTYADKTIYNFTEMTRNIGTFTAAGVDLQTSTNAIQGIANLAAVSGSSSQQASTAMYQLSQALAAGTVKLMDWNSVVNAGMGGQIFQDALKKTSEELGTGAEAAIKASGSFRESLRDGWLTSEVLTETLKKFTTSGANEYISEFTGLSVEAIEAELKKVEGIENETDALEKAAEAIAKKSGKDKDAILESLKFAKTAEDAATKVKTFTQLWDVLKEAAQSGWAKTWQLLIGDFKEAKALLSPLADLLVGFINKMSDARNVILGSALGKGFTSLIEKFQDIGKTASKVTDPIKNVVDSVTDLGDIVDKVILGEFGNGAERFNALSEAGINFYEVQNKVNETLGCSFRYTKEQIEEQDKLLGTQKKSAESTSKQSDATAELTDETKKLLKEHVKLSDEELKNLGYSDKQIEAYKELRDTADKLGMSYDYFIDNIDKLDGRMILIESFKNLGKSLISIFKAVGDAWTSIFDSTTEEKAESLFNAIANFHKITVLLTPSAETLDKLTRTLKGVFAAADIVATVLAGPLKIAIKIVAGVLKVLGISFLDITAWLGDLIVKLRDGIDRLYNFNGIVDKIAPVVMRVVDVIAAFVNSFGGVEGILDRVTNSIKKLYYEFEIFGHTPADIISGLANGLRNGASEVWAAIVDIAQGIVDKFCEILGIHSPSTVMIAIGGFIISGLLIGMKTFFPEVWETISSFGSEFLTTFKETLGDVDWGQIFSAAMSAGMLSIGNKFANALEGFAAPAEGLGSVLEGTGEILSKSAGKIKAILGQVKGVVKAFKGVVRGVSFKIIAAGIKDIAIGIAILVGSLLLLTLVDDTDKLWSAVGIIGALAGIILGLSAAVAAMAFAMSKLDVGKLEIAKLSVLMISLGAALIMIAAVVKIIGGMDFGQAVQGIVGVIVLITAMVGVIAAFGYFVNFAQSANISKLGGMMIKMSIALLLMVGVVKLISMLSAGELIKGGIAIMAFVGIVTLLGIAANAAGEHSSKFGGTMLKLSLALILMVGVVKLINTLSAGELAKGGIVILGFVGIVALLAAIVKSGGSVTEKLGGTILALSSSLIIMAATIKILGTMDIKAIAVGLVALTAFVGIIARLVKIVKSAGNEVPKIAGTLLALSVALAIMAAAVVLLGMFDIAAIAKGVVAIGLLGLVISKMIKATKGASDVKGSIMAMAVAIGVMAASVAILSFIDGSKLAGAVVAMTMLMMVFALMTLAASKVQAGGMGSLIVMVVAIGLLAGILIALDKLNIGSSIEKVAALSMLMIAMSGVLFIMSKMNTTVTDAVQGALSLLLLAVPLVAFAMILQYMGNIQNAMSNAAALSLLMLAMAGVLLILTTTINVGTILNAVLGVLALTAMAIPLFAFVKILQQMQGVTNAMTNVQALILLVGALTLLLIPLTIIGTFVLSAAAGIIALTAMAIPLFAFVEILRQMQDIQNAMSNVLALTTLLTTMTGVLTILAIIGPFALVGVTALAALTALMVGIGVLAIAVGALMEQFPALQSFLDTGIPVLEQLANAVGSIIGNLIAGFAEAAASSLPTIATSLSQFMTNLSPFITIASSIPDSVLTGIGNLSAAIIALTAANLISGIGQFLSFGQSFADLGTQLSSFIFAAMPFIVTMMTLDPKIVESASILANMIMTLTKAELLSGIAKLFGLGDQNYEEIGVKLAGLGKAVVAFAKEVNGKVDASAVSAAAQAGQMFVELNKSIPRSGGLLQDIIGEQDMATFAASCEAFGKAMVRVSKAFTGENGENTFNEAAVSSVAKAGMLFSELQNALPRSGGLLQDVIGEAELAAFGTSCEAFATCMKNVSASLTGEGGESLINEGAVEAATKAGSLFADIQNALPKTGGLWQEVAGAEDIGAFGESIKAFGTAITEFSNNTKISEEAVTSAEWAGKIMASLQESIPEDGWFDGRISLDEFGSKIQAFGSSLVTFSNTVASVNVDNVSNSITQAKRLASLSKSVVDLDTSGIENFKKITGIGTSIKAYNDEVSGIDATIVTSSVTSANKLKNLLVSLTKVDPSGVSNFKIQTIGTAMKTYSANVASIDAGKVTSSISAAGKLKNLINGLAGINTGGVSDFKSAVEELGTVSIQKMVDAFSVSTAQLSSAGANLVNSIVDGFNSKSPALPKTVVKTITEMQNAIKNSIAKFKTAGVNVVKAFVDGIKSQSKSTSTAMNSGISSAISSIRGKYSSFVSAGKWLGDGLVSGMKARESAVYNAGYRLGQKAVQGEKAGQASNSPSKLTIQAGKWLGEGLVIGMKAMGTKVYNAGHTLGNNAANSMSASISKISDAIMSDIDVQPTIRPVLDLSDVRSGTSTLSDMLNFGASVGVLSNVGTISRMMNTNSQNGGTDEIVSAIRKLGKDLGNAGGTQYNINGITYNDDTPISDAVSSLIRAITLEGRI